MNTQLLKIVSSAFISSCKAFQSAHPQEEVYLVGLYTCGEYMYLVPTFSTVQGLEQVARQYLEMPYYQENYGTLEAMMQDLRWNPCDSPHHTGFEEHFDKINDSLSELWHDINTVSSELFTRRCKAIHEISMQAIKNVRDAGLFDKNQVLFHFLMGDQSDEERYLNARDLNEGPVLDSYVKDLEIDQESLQNLIATRWVPID